ncbi:MAG: calcium/sodium antiporter [Chlamydiales bacterium]
MLLNIFLFIIGLIALFGGGRLLVTSTANVASQLKVSSLIISLTVISFGTSAPETFVSGLAAWRGNGEIVVGNVVGSNIFNILLVVGLGATLIPLQIKKMVIHWGIPWMLAVSLIFWGLSWRGSFYRYEGFLLLAGLFIYLYFAFRVGKKEPLPVKPTDSRNGIWLQIFWIIISIILLSWGSNRLIDSSIKLAKALHVSEFFISLLMIAIGTSLPELATTIMAISKKEYDIIVGNVVGSNIFNILGVMGISIAVAPSPLLVPSKAITFDIPVMVACAIAAWPIFITGHKISRWEGALFLFYYLLYVAYLIMRSENYAILPLFTTAFFFFILPLTLITLLITFFRHVHRNH